MNTPRKPTRSQAVHDRIRADILAGRLRPGERLKFAPLAVQYDASVSVLREALARLAERGLAHITPQVGCEVARLSRADLLDCTAVRDDIEGLALRYAIERGDLRWESELVAAFHVLDRTAVADPETPEQFSQAWNVLHDRFHAALIAGCGSPRLARLANDLRVSAELYRLWSRPLAHDVQRDVPGEHRLLFEATLARDADRACDLLSGHIRRTTDALLGVAALEDDDGGIPEIA